MCKVEMARVQQDILERAVHLHGALGVSRELPLSSWRSQSLIASSTGD